MPKFLTRKEVVIPIILIACMLLFIVVRLAIRDRYSIDGDIYGYPVVVATDDADENAVNFDVIGVHITGAVNNPGFYEVPRGSRVNDLIQIAGGATEYAFLDAINLAEIAHDQMQIHVPVSGEMTPDGLQRRINLNTATAAELQTLPGVGPAVATRIIDLRQRMGGFRRVEDLLNVNGIGPTVFENMRDLIIVP